MTNTHARRSILSALVGQERVSEWHTLSQSAIDTFAEATGDRQWIHLDVERARRESPYGGTIAHGFLTLALISHLLRDAVPLPDGIRVSINYGLNKVRFPAPVPAGARIRGRFTLSALADVDDGVQATWTVVIEREGGEKPCCVAEWLVRYRV